ncbi:MAG: BrnA antitoxin family protein [Pseudomonadota bacterium]
MTTKIKIILPTAEEDAAITAAALADPDALPLSDQELAQFRPMRPRGRPVLESKKIATSIRLDPQVIQAFKSTGQGWQSRMNDVLLEWATSHGLLESSSGQ